MAETKDRHSAPGTKGRVLHAAAGYDLLVWLFLWGRERAFRERLVTLARLEPGESVLDVGCGTGSLAIAAKRRVGECGVVHGIDASPAMVARAGKKARKAGVDVRFTHGVIESLPVPDGSVDVVLNTVMLHHLPRAAREQGAREMRRVLRSGGRVLAADFGRSTPGEKSLVSRLHRHGRVDVEEVVGLFNGVGLRVVETGAVGVGGMHFVLGAA